MSETFWCLIALAVTWLVTDARRRKTAREAMSHTQWMELKSFEADEKRGQLEYLRDMREADEADWWKKGRPSEN